MPAGYLHDASDLSADDYNYTSNNDNHLSADDYNDQTDDHNNMSADDHNDQTDNHNNHMSADDYNDQEALSDNYYDTPLSSGPADNRAQTGLGFWRPKPRALWAPGTRLYAERALPTI
jgi:hypothetical protein